MSGSQVEWAQVAEDFRPDGALRDLYVLNASMSDWQSVYDAVRGTYSVVLRDSQALPAHVGELFRHDAGVTLSVDPEGLDAICHFFTEEEIEFDLVPSRVTSQEGLDRVLEFMRLIARATGKNAILTLENCVDAVILEYDLQRDQFVHDPDPPQSGLSPHP